MLKEALEVADRVPFPLGGVALHVKDKVSDVMNTGVAYQRLGGYSSVAKYYELAFALLPQTDRLALGQVVKNSVYMQKTAARDWVGTSGCFTP